MTLNLVEINNEQIRVARQFKVLQDLSERVFARVRAANKAMVYCCSDGRYSWDILQHLWGWTGAQLHLYADHGGALNLAGDCRLQAEGSTLKYDRMQQIATAHLSMGYDILLNICHGPECKALINREMQINASFDCYQTVAPTIGKMLPRLEVFNLFHRDKGDDGLRLYEYSAETWRSLRAQYPEPKWLPGSQPIIAPGLNV